MKKQGVFDIRWLCGLLLAISLLLGGCGGGGGVAGSVDSRSGIPSPEANASTTGDQGGVDLPPAPPTESSNTESNLDQPPPPPSGWIRH
jgi:hypothetical protein